MLLTETVYCLRLYGISGGPLTILSGSSYEKKIDRSLVDELWCCNASNCIASTWNSIYWDRYFSKKWQTSRRKLFKNAHPSYIYMYLAYLQVHIGSMYYRFYSKNCILISFYCQYFLPELKKFCWSHNVFLAPLLKVICIYCQCI